MRRTNNSRFSHQVRLSCKTQIHARRHFVQSWLFYYLAQAKLLFYLGCAKFLLERCYHLEQLLETDYWLQLNPDLAKICQQNACKRLWIGLEIDIKKKLHFLSPNHTSKLCIPVNDEHLIPLRGVRSYIRYRYYLFWN